MGRLDGRVALITGAARGIGSATARRFAAEGAHVIVTDRRDELGQAVAEEIGGRYLSLDVTSEEDWGRVIADVGRLDVLVNNAGIMRIAPLLETDLDTFRKVLDTNLVSAFLGLKTAAPAMDRGGSIINFSSPQGLEGRHGMSAYTASKFGVRGLTRTAAMELGPLGIRVNAVVPGPTKTPMTARKGWSDADYDAAYGGYPLGRMGEPDEIAGLCLFLASDDAAFCTGADFIVDGGVLAGKPAERTQ
jgi:3alpha(or 20beta)-hydroxysteroid dehydrogenase